MKNRRVLSICRSEVENACVRFFDFGRINWLLCLGFFLFAVVGLYGASLMVMPFDERATAEICQRLTTKAEKSPLGYAFNSVTMEPLGNSDSYVFSSNVLQNFQMRNQHYEGQKDYVFSGYVPANGYTAFRYESTIDCTILNYESKFNGTGFYFDLPLLAGHFERFAEKKTAIVMDSFAKKLLAKESDKYSDLIGQNIAGVSITRFGKSSDYYKIGAIVGSNSSIGRMLLAAFGEDILFVPEYNVFQMTGSLYYLASTNREENSILLSFISKTYRSYYGASYDLAIGYNAVHRFFDYDYATNSLSLGEDQITCNSILEFYSGRWPVVLGVVGFVLFCTSLGFIVFLAVRLRAVLAHGLGVCLAWVWVCFSASLLVCSILYRFASIDTILIKTSFSTTSFTVSSSILLGWLLYVGSPTFLLLYFFNKRRAALGWMKNNFESNKARG